jgi:hypothetical protein
MNTSVPSGQERPPAAVDETMMAAAWTRSEGRCECRSLAHGHDLRCNRALVWPNRNRALGRGAWRLLVRAGGGSGGPHVDAVCAHCAARDWTGNA